jgi:hypothetical protein
MESTPGEKDRTKRGRKKSGYCSLEVFPLTIQIFHDPAQRKAAAKDSFSLEKSQGHGKRKGRLADPQDEKQHPRKAPIPLVPKSFSQPYRTPG